MKAEIILKYFYFTCNHDFRENIAVDMGQQAKAEVDLGL